MGVCRTSRYVIELGEDERVELERRAATPTLPWREVQRARMILYAAEGMQDIDIASRLDCHPEVVSKWRGRFCELRIEGLKDKPRAGRPRRFPPGAGRRGQGDRVRAAGHARPAAVALQSL
ncbi:MAG TPA: helix-turn-helix domain-containing protein [Solirubrobacterales bacterium]|nr:helix-turn-helix domain-containing protein [Solirubrobacterales bacterium]